MITYSIVLLSKVHPVFFFLTRSNAFYFLFDGILKTNNNVKSYVIFTKNLRNSKLGKKIVPT